MTAMPTALAFAAGVRAFDERDYGTAAQNFCEVLAAEPHNTNAREYLARSYYHRASLGRAEAECRTLLAEDPTNEYVLLLLIRSLERKGRTEEAAALRRQLAVMSGDERHLANHTIAS